MSNRWAYEGREATALITNKDLPEPLAYTVTKTIIENKDALVRGHAGLTEFDPKTAWQPDKVGSRCIRGPSAPTARSDGCGSRPGEDGPLTRRADPMY